MENKFTIGANVSRKGFVWFADQLIEEKKKTGHLGLVRVYQSSLKSLILFVGNTWIPFHILNHEFIRDYVEWLENRGISRNTVHFYLRNIRAIYNRAQSLGCISSRKNPFEGLSFTPQPTVKRSLSKNKLRKILDLNLVFGTPVALTRDMFMFSFYSCGMGYADMAYLRHSNIHENMIRYQRVKTKREVVIFLESPMLHLIDRYRREDSDYVWPILLDDASLEENYQRYRSGLTAYNRNLARIGEKLDIQGLSSYVARHTWATVARNNLMPTAIISTCLGHASERTTQIYLDSFNSSLIRRINKKVIEL